MRSVHKPGPAKIYRCQFCGKGSTDPFHDFIRDDRSEAWACKKCIERCVRCYECNAHIRTAKSANIVKRDNGSEVYMCDWCVKYEDEKARNAVIEIIIKIIGWVFMIITIMVLWNYLDISFTKIFEIFQKVAALGAVIFVAFIIMIFK